MKKLNQKENQIMLASKIVFYYKIYKEYLEDNKDYVDNDIKIISCSSLVEFVDKNINEDYRKVLIERIIT